ncbi:general secretion pathway protein A [Sphingobium cupriresistens LL01]|uniref:General secretion pathway protein A n=1 Tax=Sphingobium cupriresistens LL01 TaxID=1420583 RepID=A0A0J7Y3R7_9SPHN|nr:general secretion pathway protein A [Sphingobium cupriresistens LL01]
MYDQFYGLQGRPFQLTPDPHYYFESATHRKALSYLGYGLAQGEGFIVITGDIGAGKTTLVGHLMQTIDPARLTAVKIVSTQVEGDDMLRLAAQSFGLSTDGLSKAAILQQVEAMLHAQARAGRRSLLIVDEAQNLPVSAIEELRMLSNFQLGGQSLLQIFLLGQPEFRDLLQSPELEQLRQRVIATHHLEPMMANEVEPYILHRLAIAGWSGDPAFTPGAFSGLYAATNGVPRRLNALASRVLLLGAIEQLHVIDEEVVDAVVADMGLDVDIAPAPVAPSLLDVAEEPEAVEQESVELAVAEESVEEEQIEDQPAPPPFSYHPAEDQVADELAEEDTIELDAAWARPDRTTAEIEPVAAAAFDPVEPEDDYAVEEPVTPSVAAPFARPAFAAFAPPQAVESVVEPEAELDPVEDEAEPEVADVAAPFALEQDEADSVVEAEPSVAVEAFDDVESLVEAESVEAGPESFVEPAAEALATVDAVDIEVLRADMLGEIEALRAEIASLRAVQSHIPFGQPVQAEIDPEALKGCFTLIEERLSALEFRAEEQDTALRRVLTLLVDWVEREERMADVQAGVAA